MTKSNQFRHISIIVIFCILFLFFWRCGDPAPEGDYSYPLETAKMVSGVSSGVLNSNESIQVIFVTDMVTENLTGQPLKKQVFSFKPEIEGVTQWKDRHTLVFTPGQKLLMRQAYTGQLDLNALLPQHTDKELKPLPISFLVAGREINAVEGDFVLLKSDDPGRVRLEGFLSFSVETNKGKVQSASMLSLGSKTIKLDWEEVEKNIRFQFVSDAFIRKQSSQKLIFTVDQKRLELSKTYEQSFTLPGITEFKAVDIYMEANGKNPQLRVEFSDRLFAGQDITGLIHVEPKKDIELKILDKQVVVKGNFDRGREYSLVIEPGIRSRWGTETETTFTEQITFEDMLPEIRFSNDGIFLASSNQRKIMFQSVNVRRVYLNIKKVFESNLGQYLQMERLDKSKSRRNNFSYNINRVGVSVYKDTLEIGTGRNRWLQHEINLQKLIDSNEKGLFLIDLSFKKEDMIYDLSDENPQYRSRGRNRYNDDPRSYGYLRAHGKCYKPLIVSDIGLVYKKADQSHYIYTTDLISAKVMRGVNVRLMSYQNQLISEGTTDRRGIAEFNGIQENVFYVVAEKAGQRSVVKPSDMSWNLSTFDTRGVESGSKGLQAFIYTERGVYRPGDAVNISAILRNSANTFPENHPVSLQIVNPKKQIVHEAVNKEGKDGFYNFAFSTKVSDLTGTYMVSIKAGSQTFSHPLKIETIVPDRLKLTFNPEKINITPKEKYLTFDLAAKYLFGNPASNLNGEVSINITSIQKPFSKYSDYIFQNEAVKFTPKQHNIFKGKLDAQGRVKIKWTLPSFQGVPGAIQGLVTAKALDPGGRPNQNRMQISIDPYSYYVGIQKPQLKYWYAPTGQELEIPVILLNIDGVEETGHTLYYRIFRNDQYWWWEYNSREQFRLRFKKDYSTELVKSGTVVSGNAPNIIKFTPESRGEYLIEVQDGSSDGHLTAFFMRAYPWGSTPAAGKNAGILAIGADQEKYTPGESAKVSFPVPANAAVLLTIEKAHQVLSSEWYRQGDQAGEMKLKIPITKEMLPTAYASVAVIQPHAQTVNDRPIRLYGVVPLNIEEKSTHQDLHIIMEDEIKPKKSFSVQIQTRDRKPTQVTVAVVDEGLLSLTNFDSPDPWKSFFRKQRLGVQTFDLFSHVIGVNFGDIFRTFSIGGGMSANAYRMRQMAEAEHQKAKRFEPVCMFQGPVMTDENGRAVFNFNMPNYIGAVRVMAVGANSNRYGNSEKYVPVKTNLMVMPTLPRVIGPGETFKLPVTVFAMKENLGQVVVSIKTSGPLEVVGQDTISHIFKSNENRDIYFRLKTSAEIGVARIEILAKAQNAQADFSRELAVRSSSPTNTETNDIEIEPGQTITTLIPNKGLKGTNQATISINYRPKFDFNRRIYWLIRYPYGCIEQTVSAVFPQLYLGEFLPKSRLARRDIDRNINEAINRLRGFLVHDGGLSYWPGGRKPSAWGSIYSAHFLIEAKSLGYNVPQSVLDQLLNYLEKQTRERDEHYKIPVYRLYVLALAGRSQMGAMNIMKESHLENLDNTEKWLLAGAYELAGVKQVAGRIIAKAGIDIKEYQEFGNTYGSALRDKAMILEQMVVMKRWNQAKTLADELSIVLSSQRWYSTQTTGFILLALGKYIKAFEGESADKTLKGRIILANGTKVDFDVKNTPFLYEVKQDFGKEIKVELESSSTVNRGFVTTTWSGKPIQYYGQTMSKNLQLQVDFLDEDGMTINPTSLPQGSTFWIHLRASKPQTYRTAVEELALVQILPSGWEIENTRLGSARSRPNWMRKWRLNQEEYLDIRDDRIMWFFDFRPRDYNLDFIVKINTVTEGQFVLPATLLEAMYNQSFKAMQAGKDIKVTER